MNKRLLNISITFICLLGCTSCFDLNENVFFKKDGSGNFSFSVDLGEMKSMMSMFDSFGKDLDNKGNMTIKKTPINKLNTQFEIKRRELLNTKGISNVNLIEDTINYTFGFKFDFKNIDALNVAMNTLFKDDSTQTKTENKTYFAWKNNQFIRYEQLDSKSFLGSSSIMSGGNIDNGLFNLNKLFETATYSTSYEFENKIDSTYNTNAMLSSTFKKVTLTCHPFAEQKDSTQKKCTIANTITLK